MAELEVECVSKVYPPDVTAVADLSFSIGEGEFVVLVGPSGCGKTTTLRLLAGLEAVSTGTIRINGVSVNDVPPKDRDIAMVFQSYALYPHMTVYKNLAFGLLLRADAGWLSQAWRRLFDRPAYAAARRQRREIRGKVEWAANLLGIEALLKRRPASLSGGERQRVALGRAIVREPQAFLFDEPLSNLDAKLRVEMRAELKRLHRRLATTTLYVTHDQEEAMTLGDRVVVMKDGRVQQEGPPLEVYQRPANRFVAGFIGMPAMNFLSGRLVDSDGGLFFEGRSIRLRIPAERAATLAGNAGRDVVLGLRPETLSDRRDGPNAGPEATIDAVVSVVEPLGDRMDVHLETPMGSELVCRLDARRPLREGDRVRMYVDMGRAHVFEPGDCGVNLALGRHAGAGE